MDMPDIIPAPMDLTQEELRGVDQLLGLWLLRCRVALKAYNYATTRAVAAERRLGIPAAALSALVATGVFATLSSDPDLGWRIATGIVAAVAATLTALQTFLRQGERAEQFHEAARGYGRLRRRIEQARLFLPSTREEALETLNSLAAELAEISLGKPNVPQSTWERAEYLVKGDTDARGHRALLLRLKERLKFGVADGRGPLPEDHRRYFDLESAEIVPVEDVQRVTRDDGERSTVIAGRRRLRRAMQGGRPPEPPLAVVESRAGYELVDGKAILSVAIEEGWRTVPVKVVIRTQEQS